MFARIVSRRIRQLRSYTEAMLSGEYYVRGDHNEITMMASQFVSCFESGDLYLTISTPWLWYRRNLGVMGRFWSVNKAAIKRGVSMRRVMIVTPQDAGSERVIEVLTSQAMMLNELDDETNGRINTTLRELDHGGVFIGVLIMSERDRRHLVSQDEHNGVWFRDAESKMVVPSYDPPVRRLGAVGIRKAVEKASDLRNQFVEDYLNNRETVEVRRFLRKHRQ
jgi:hypothetical protein